MTRLAFWSAFWAVLLLLPADLAQAQGQARVILWDEAPTIGMDSRDSARVDDSLAVIATADWPEFTDTVLVELAACTHLTAPNLAIWRLRTVAAPFFHVTLYQGSTRSAPAPFIGYTFPHVQRIYVAQDGLFVRGLIKHELVHAFLAVNGLDPDHGTPLADRLFKRCLKP